MSPGAFDFDHQDESRIIKELAARACQERDKRIYSHEGARARKKAKEERRQGKVKKFIGEQCQTGGSSVWCPLKELYEVYAATRDPGPALSKIMFSKTLQELGFEKLKGRAGAGFNGVYFTGIDLE